MTNKLVMLYNTLALVETKGDSSIRMGDCLKYLQQMIQESAEADKKAEEEADESTEDKTQEA